MSGYKYGATLTRMQIAARKWEEKRRADRARMIRENIRPPVDPLAPGDTPEICATRLVDAALEAYDHWSDPRTRTRRGATA